MWLAYYSFACGGKTFCPLSLPCASYINGRAGGRWARLGYASWSPFTFVGVVPVLVSCPLRSVAWHATYLGPTSHVRMFSFFFFFFFFFFVLCFTSVVFLFLLVCPFIPCCSSVAVMALRRSGHAGIPFFPCVSGGEHRHSVPPLVGFPCRFGCRCAYRGGALWRCLTRYLFCACYSVMHTTYGT